jgi:hypothetical protein
VEEKSTFGSPFLGAFYSELISKAKKDVNVPFFIHNFPHAGEFLRLLHVFSFICRKCVHIGFSVVSYL